MNINAGNMKLPYRLFQAFAATILLIVVGTVHAIAKDQVETHQLKFAKGTYETTVKGTVKGYNAAQYLVELRAGQTVSVSMRTSNESAVFDITYGEAFKALNPGSSYVDFPFTGTVPTDGVYTITVSLPRSSARRHEHADFTLTVSAR